MKLCARTLTFLLTAAILAVTARDARADGPVSIGVNGSGQLSRDAHIGWIRTGVYWSEINRDSWSPMDFERADQIVYDAVNNGQQVLYVLSGAPQWCGGGPRGTVPCPIEFWKAYVDAISKHYNGVVAAYEIWNEPDLQGQAAYAVGWDFPLGSNPRYIDYFTEAARIIRANAPGTLIVGPAMSGSTSRAVTIWEQFDQTWYPDGKNASSFVDVVSFHHNSRREDEHSEKIACDIRDRINNIIRRFNPKNGWKPMWVTEFGWKSDQIGEVSQKTRTKNLLIEMGGGGYGILRGYNIPRAFIYVLATCDGDRGWSLYRCDSANPPVPRYPKWIVSNYLWNLPFPATQSQYTPRE